MTWEPVIGIEVHVELQTDSKMFCGCAVDFSAPPNTNVCPVCLGLPGALPVPNRRAIEWITKIGMALDCQISTRSQFHRKNYFYADQPKNYQISQFDVPVCHDGVLEVESEGVTASVRINRAHMEEDTGKSIHVGGDGRIHAATATLLDFNRAGVPLVEIVSEPDIRTPSQARVYAQTLRALVASLGVSDAKLEEGSIRFDANVSVRPAGSTELGTKVEIKNMNSFRSLEKAVDYEIRRQSEVLESGETLVQETRHWDEAAGVTHGMRTKEGSSDYRYFPEPDLLPLEVDEAWQREIRSSLPELPSARRSRYESLGLDRETAGVLVASDDAMVAWFEAALDHGADPKLSANWLTGEVVAYLRRESREAGDLPLTGSHLAELAAMVEDGKLSSTAAKDALQGVLAGEGRPAEVAAARDLLQISDASALEKAVDAAIEAEPDSFERLRSGEDKLMGFFVGQVMRASGGKADPKIVTAILRQRLTE